MMMTIRRDLADALRQQCNSDRFDFIAEHRGMFSRLGLPPEQVQSLRDDPASMSLVTAGSALPARGGKHETFARVAKVASAS